MNITVQWILVAALAAAIAVIAWLILRNRSSCNGCPLADGCARKGESRKCTLEESEPEKKH